MDAAQQQVFCAVCCLQVINVTPRYAKLLDTQGSVFGWENFELISGESKTCNTYASAWSMVSEAFHERGQMAVPSAPLVLPMHIPAGVCP